MKGVVISRYWPSLAMAWLLLAMASPAMAVSLEHQRELFQQARQALKSDQPQNFEQLYGQLRGYPLTPYLDIWQAWRQLGSDEGDLAIAKVLAEHGDVPESIDLRMDWIANLAERGQWPHVAAQLEKLPAAERVVPETAILAWWYTGRSDAAYALFSKQWGRGATISPHLSRFYAEWKKSGQMTHELVWQRISHFAKAGRWSEARGAALHLPESERELISFWRSMRHDPAKALKKWPQDLGHKLPGRLMVNDGLHRLARSDAAAAWKVLSDMQEKLPPELYQKLQQQVAIKAAKEHLLPAAAWLASLPAAMQTEETRAWQVRIHLLYGDWQQALATIRSMPQQEQESSCWMYWQARCVEALKSKEHAASIYVAVAMGRGYYSFLSAERMGLPYHLNSEFAEVNTGQMGRLKVMTEVRRASEWWKLGETEKAAREWHAALKGAGQQEWEAAAVLAARWGWHDRAIRAAHYAGRYDALEYRFPLGFEAAVLTAARDSGLQMSLVWSVIRQESAFNPKAVSFAGARGLMQLMPATAKQVAQRYKVSSGRPDLFVPEVNVRLGAYYLAQMKKKFHGNEAIAVAAYNAGPGRVSQWLKRTPFESADIWIEAIPFNETRKYVQQVMAFSVVYDWRQAKTPVQVVKRISHEPAEQG